MTTLKVAELFSGIGAFTKALTNLKVDYELVGFSEIDEKAIKSYCVIHNVSEDLNLGDISKLDTESLPDMDLMTYSFPCQAVSKAGRLGGYSEGSGTSSSLLWEAMKVASVKKPKYLIAENVPNLLSKRFRNDFEKWIEQLDELNYNSYYKILNSREYGIAQNRERVFVVSIRKDVDTGFKFPEKQILHTSLVHYLDIEVDESYYINKDLEDKLIIGQTDEHLLIRNATKKGYAEASHGDGIDFNYPTSETRRGRVQPQRAHTLTTSNNLGVLLNGRLRRFTSNEMWRLMGFTDEDYQKAKDQGIKEAALVKQAGNSIVVNVAEAIFKELLHVN